jgi:hypothetical protein
MEPETPWVRIKARVALEVMATEKLGVFINPRYECQVRLRSKELAALLAGQFDVVRGTDA